MSPSPPDRQIVIIGGGIIGCTTAYYITHHPSFSAESTMLTLVEASKRGVAQGASGKAGGLVAKWAEPKDLAEMSFAEHVRLAKELGGEERWGWRYAQCAMWRGRGGEGEGKGKEGEGRVLPDDLRWVKEELTDVYEPLAPHGDTAQVHPYQFTSTMLELALSKGLHVIYGRATSIEQSDGTVSGVTYSTDDGTRTTIPATHVILAAGAWSPTLLPSLPISGARVHSITIHPASEESFPPYSLFAYISIPGHTNPVEPEIYPRRTEVYACGPPDECPLPGGVDEVEVDADACARIHEHVGSISDELRDGEVTVMQACFMPMMTSGGDEGPVIGELTKIAKGLIVAAGHSCWVSRCDACLAFVDVCTPQGICNAPGTARMVSEAVIDGVSVSVEL
jgi:glycine/D-amino acid oxidase-like deaminating enzyme